MIIQKFINIIAREPKKLFLIDGFGALLSSFLYGTLVANFESVFGMPKQVVYGLGVMAGIYAVYSFLCYLIKLKNWRLNMKIIAIANLLHCCLTIGLAIFYFQDISMLGILYFFGEICIIVALAIYELKIASHSNI